jgi:hypothetical protein
MGPGAPLGPGSPLLLVESLPGFPGAPFRPG